MYSIILSTLIEWAPKILCHKVLPLSSRPKHLSILIQGVDPKLQQFLTLHRCCKIRWVPPAVCFLFAPDFNLHSLVFLFIYPRMSLILDWMALWGRPQSVPTKYKSLIITWKSHWFLTLSRCLLALYCLLCLENYFTGVAIYSCGGWEDAAKKGGIQPEQWQQNGTRWNSTGDCTDVGLLQNPSPALITLRINATFLMIEIIVHV